MIEKIKELHPKLSKAECEIDARVLQGTRLSNLFITLDKVKHCLDMMGTTAPPLVPVSYEDLLGSYWEGSDFSIKNAIHKQIDALDNSVEKIELNDLFWKCVENKVDETPKEKF